MTAVPMITLERRRYQRRHQVSISALRTSLRFLLDVYGEDQEFQMRLKLAEDMIQQLEQPTNLKGFLKVLLKNTRQDINKVFSPCDQDSRYGLDIKEIPSLCAPDSTYAMQKRLEHVVRFFDCAVPILQDVCNDKYAEEETMHPFILGKKQSLEVLDELKFLKNFLSTVGSSPIGEVKHLLVSAQHIAVQICCLFFDFLMDDEMNDDEVNALPALVEKVNTLRTVLEEFIAFGCWNSQPQNDDGIDATDAMDEQVVDFFDFHINKLRKLYTLPNINKPAKYGGLPAVKDQLDALVSELSFLRINLWDLLLVFSQEGFTIKEIKSVAVSAHSLMKSLESETEYLMKDKLSSPNYCSFKLFRLHKSVVSLKRKAADLYSGDQHLSSNLSSGSPNSIANQIDSFDFQIKNLEERMRNVEGSAIPLKHQIETLYQKMVSMRKRVMSEISDHQLGNSQMENLVARFKQAAFLSSFIIDSFLAGECLPWHHMLGMFVVTNDIKTTDEKRKAIRKKMTTSETNTVSSISSSLSSFVEKSPNTNMNEAVGSKDKLENMKLIDQEATCNKLVGVKDAASQIIQLLVERPSQLKILYIVGMPGIGKTTLANSVYNHPSIDLCFHIRAWCRVSQVYEKETLLSEILSQIVGRSNHSHRLKREDIDQKLYQKLKGRKYLIVIDDIWDLEVWNDLKKSFPDDHKGSRILFTTRYRSVASTSNSLLYEVRLLSNEESCKLLWLEIFGRGTCPPELSIVSERIAMKCKGLPLAVVLMAGILKRTERRKGSWEQVAATFIKLRGINENDLDITEFNNILELSYKHLPDSLKPCFLYFGALPEDTSISVSKLIQLWISERFVQEANFGRKSLEEEARGYLDELIDRSLVMIARRSSKARVKECRVHDVLRDFCFSKSQQEVSLLEETKFGGTFYLRVHPKMQIHSFLYHYRSHGTPKSGWSFSGEAFSNRSLGLRDELSEGAPFIKKPVIKREEVSESAWAISTRTSQLRKLDYGFILHYQFLEVLDLGNVRIESSADACDIIMIANLIHLRHLAIRPRTTRIPLEIGNLRNLETFILTRVIGHIMLPESLWNLVSLRNVLMDHGFFNVPNCSKIVFKNLSQLHNLKSISTICLPLGDDVEKFIHGRLPGIQKLGCKFSVDSWDDSAGCSIFPVLDFLSELESLKVFFSGKVACPCKFSFPLNLKKMFVSNSRLPWEEISVIGRLPNLEVLKLVNKAFEGQQWDMRDGEFQKLKFLKLESLDIVVWNAFAEHLPCLEQLVVLSCPQLKQIPSSFGEICTLELIEMKWCSSSAMDSVNQILEVQHDFSNYQLKVTLVGSALI